MKQKPTDPEVQRYLRDPETRALSEAVLRIRDPKTRKWIIEFIQELSDEISTSDSQKKFKPGETSLC